MNDYLLMLSVPFLFFLGSSCSSSHAGLGGTSGRKSPLPITSRAIGATQAKSSKSEPGQDALSRTATASPLGDTISQSKLNPIEVGIIFQQRMGDAQAKNCVQIALNAGQQIELGCNKDGDISRTIKLAAFPRPSINSLRVVFSKDGKKLGTTEDGSAITRLKINKESNSFTIGYEDSNDNDYNDYVFSITIRGDVSLKIENCEKNQCAIQ